MNGLQKISKDLGKVITKNSTTILTGMGVAGFVTTVVTAVYATPKAMKLIEEREYYSKEDNVRYSLLKKEIIKLTWKAYLPSAIIGTLSIACFVSANSISMRRNAALAGAYSLAETTLREYRTKVVEQIGKPAERKIRDEVAKDKVNANPVNDSEIVFTGKGDTLCYDALGGRYFKSDIEFIRKVINEAGAVMRRDDTIMLNDIYYELGLSNTKLGDVIGWHIDDGILLPDFSSTLTEKDVPCLVLNFNIEPRYMDFA